MTRKLWTATLVPSSPRYQDWRGILGSDEVPLLNGKPFSTQLGDDTETVYKLDLERFTREQAERLAAWIVEHFGCTLRTARGELASRGFPIREADVSVSFSMRAFL
jgi:hypothetical protein